MQYFKLKINQISKNEVEYGWIDSEPIIGDCIHCVNNTTKQENLSLVLDHVQYFNYYTGLEPKIFLEKFKDSSLLEEYWKNNYPNKKSGQHLFFLNIAKLILYGESFTQYDNTYSKKYIS